MLEPVAVKEEDDSGNEQLYTVKGKRNQQRKKSNLR